jgi:transposase
VTELEKRQAETIELQCKQIEQLCQENLRLRQENTLLREKVDYLLRKLFGPKSEKLDAAQLELLFAADLAKEAIAAGNEDNQADTPDVSEADNVIPISKNKQHKKNRRPRLPENLPVTEEIIIPAEVQAAPDGN